MVIDTGNSDTWVHDANADMCNDSSDSCKLGAFNASKSSTFADQNRIFDVQYFDAKNGTGGFGTDKLKIGKINLDNFEFGLANQSSTPCTLLGCPFYFFSRLLLLPGSRAKNSYILLFLGNMLGLSYLTGEADPGYATFPDSLYTEKLVESGAFSLWLNDVEESSGEILFGGINRGKFKGELHMMNVVVDDDSTYSYTQFRVTLDSLHLNIGNGKSVTTLLDKKRVANVDTGSPYIRMPLEVVQKALAELDAYGPTPEYGIPPYLSCEARNTKGTFDFVFDGGTIRIPINKLVFPAKALAMDDELHKDACVLGIVGSEMYGGVGNTFLRNTYLVFDLDSNQIGMAEANFDKDTEDDILVIHSSGDNSQPLSLPKVTGLGKSSAEQLFAPSPARSVVLALLAGFIFDLW